MVLPSMLEALFFLRLRGAAGRIRTLQAVLRRSHSSPEPSSDRAVALQKSCHLSAEAVLSVLSAKAMPATRQVRLLREVLRSLLSV